MYTATTDYPSCKQIVPVHSSPVVSSRKRETGQPPDIHGLPHRSNFNGPAHPGLVVYWTAATTERGVASVVVLPVLLKARVNIASLIATLPVNLCSLSAALFLTALTKTKIALAGRAEYS
jgi:hypothetical protein